MYGIVLRRPSVFARSESVWIMGVRFYVCYMGRGPFSAALAVRRLRRKGVRCCLFPKSFQKKSFFARRGIVPVATEPLLRDMAAALCLAERKKRGLCGPVAIHALSAAEVKRSVEELLPHVRQLSLGMMRGRESLFAEILYERGAVLRAAPAEELAGAETLLLFAPPDFTPANTLTLPLFGDAEPRFALRRDLEEKLPPELPRLALLAALYRSGAIKREEIFPLCD